ncbi:MBL fold metallo-hydrolase [Serratia sp. M24T3]|uniref:MBL fold metallo-hydrolase n=1 Tax=Serratia sp. M24T3 TaxID=932213 RepID=UPI00025BAA7D|nr:MBL fold metallo-hydrolase [Serratia sp. M24T3]EIC86192.1 beta-lactamase domain-containing protein [Serratia sp. M24T3]
MSKDSLSHKLGKAVINKIYETDLAFNSNFLFPDWKKESSDLILSVHGWLVRHEGKIYLIDTGIGKGKKRTSPLFNDLDSPFLLRLAEQGVKPEDVDYVLMTHIHTDHVGWNTYYKDGKWQPTFPNARYVFPQEGYQYNLSDEGKAVPGYAAFVDSVLPVIEAGLADFIPAAGGVIDGKFEYISTPGHCAGHMSIRFNDEGENALFAGDVMHNLEQLPHPELVSVFCVDKPLAIATRKRILEQSAENHTLYFSSHFAGSSVGYINKQAGQFVWQPVE